MAQHPIYYDDNPVKINLTNKLKEMVDRRSELSPYPIERVEVPLMMENNILSFAFITRPKKSTMYYLCARYGSN